MRFQITLIILGFLFVGWQALKDLFYFKKLDLFFYEWITDKKYKLLRNQNINFFISKFTELKNKNISVFIKLESFISRLIKKAITFKIIEKLFIFSLFISTIIFLYLHRTGFEQWGNILYSMIIFDSTYIFEIYYIQYEKSWTLFGLVEYLFDFIETMKILNIIISVINILLGYFFFMKEKILNTQKIWETQDRRSFFAYSIIFAQLIALCFYLSISIFGEDNHIIFNKANLNGVYATVFYDMYFQKIFFIISGILHTYLLFTIPRFNKHCIIFYSISFMIIIFPMILLNSHITNLFRHII